MVTKRNSEPLRAFLRRCTFWELEWQIHKPGVDQRFRPYLPENPDFLWYNLLRPFVEDRPYRYWDDTTLKAALDLLEHDPARTADAVNTWAGEVGVAVEQMFLRSAATDDEHGVKGMSVNELQRLATLFFPEYFRLCEYVFGNLLTVYGDAVRHGVRGVTSTLRATAQLLRQRNLGVLAGGYDPVVRNSIAHGHVFYRGFEVVLRDRNASRQMAPGDFLLLLDDLARTCNALSLGILLFLARQGVANRGSVALPPRLMGLLAASSIDRSALEVHGVFETETTLVGKQLHVGVRTPFVARQAILLQIALLTCRLLAWGAARYERVVFEIDQGKPLPATAFVRPKVLAELLRQDAPLERIGEAFDDTQLLWHDEGRHRSRWRTFHLVLVTQWRRFRAENRARPRYRLRAVENISHRSRGRARATVVLLDPRDAEGRDELRAILAASLNAVRRRWFMTRFGNIGNHWGWPVRAKQICLTVYRTDGTMRWLSRGWPGGDLVAVAERVFDSGLPIHVKNPQEVWQRTRIRWSMDKVAMERALTEVAEIARVAREGRRPGQD